MAESKINDIIKVSLEKIKDIVGAETIIGSPIETAGGTTIIPVSKVAVGFASGGLDYDADKQDKDKKPSLLASASFSGGGGTGIYGRAHSAYFPANDNGDHGGADPDLFHDLNIGGLHHCVRHCERRDIALGLYKA